MTEVAEQAIRKLTDDFIAVWNRHDAKALAALWTADGDLINPFGRVAKGRDAVEQLFRDEHATYMKGATYEVTAVSVRLLTAEVAICDWVARISGLRGADGAEIEPVDHNVPSVLVKESGHWRVAAARPMFRAPSPAAPVS